MTNLMLDEIDEQDLWDELRRRYYLREQNKCDFCGGSDSAISCEFKHRHKVGTTAGKLRNQLSDTTRFGKNSVGL